MRELLINWLTASRFIRSLEARLVEQRQDYTERLGEKDSRIKELKSELATLKIECDRMRTVLMPFGSPQGAMYAQRFDTQPKPALVPEFTGPDDWQAELAKVIEEEHRYGGNGQGREAVSESFVDDGA